MAFDKSRWMALREDLPIKLANAMETDDPLSVLDLCIPTRTTPPPWLLEMCTAYLNEEKPEAGQWNVEWYFGRPRVTVKAKRKR